LSAVPNRVAALEKAWNADETNAEDVLLVYDFFRQEEDYDPARPLILCKDGGFLALFEMEGVDPEPLGEDGLARVSAGMRRAMEVFNGGSLEGQWAEGAWEVQNIFSRGPGNAPVIPEPTRDSEALRTLTAQTNDHFQGRLVFTDSILWAIKFVPRNRDHWSFARLMLSGIWSLFAGSTSPLAKLRQMRAQARFMRRVLEVFEDSVRSVTTSRPRMDLGMHWLTEDQAYRALWRQINRRWDEPPPLRAALPLLTQLTASHRDNTGAHYAIDGRPTKILTWKMPPELSVAYLYAGLQSELRFPFTVAQNFASLDFTRLSGGALGLAMRERMASALQDRHRDSAAFVKEANSLMNAVYAEKACTFHWYFAIVVSGETVHELESRVNKVGTFLKRLKGSEVMEEREHRVFGELATLPGNSRFGLRYNVVTSRNAGDLAMVYRLSRGDQAPSLLFGDRQGGVYGYSLFSRGEPSWSKAVLGPPGSGKSVLLQSFLLANAVFPSQGYVIDEGNSFGSIFELLHRENPDEVAVMRFEGGSFQFNTLPLVWAIEEKERQIAAGTYQLPLEDGTQLPDPVVAAKVFFEAWLEGLVSQGGLLAMDKKNQLDRALKGASGNGGFFREFENHCQRYLTERRRGKSDLAPPRPLSVLLTHLRREAPEFAPAVELWTRPPRDRYFDSGLDTIQRAKYVYFELTGLDGDPLVMVPFIMALMGTVWRRVMDPALIHERKAIIIDEAWKRLAHDAFFKIINEAFRTSRKFKAFVTLGTQSPNDLLEGNAQKLLQTMSEIFLYRGFSLPDAFLARDLELGPHQVRQLKGLCDDDQRKEVFYVSRRGMNRVLSVELPPALYWFVTTDGQDKEWRTLFCRRFGLSGGISELVKACDGRTVMNGNERLDRVSRHARTIGLIDGAERCA
jgi:hypothetical protein